MEDFVPSEEQLLHLQRLAVAGQISAAYAHEINNLLTGVLGYASLVRRMVADRPAVANDVDRIREQAERIAQLARHLLDLSRRESSAPESVDLGMLVDRVLGLRERQFKRLNITIRRVYGEMLPRVEAVPEEIEQVVLNIVNNAVQAMPKGGRLEVRLWLHEDGQQVCLEIKDTGCGISPEALPRVFEPFFTTKPRGQGTGLGLYVSRRIVERHGGTIAIHSEVGVGTTVQIALPLAQPQTCRTALEEDEEESWLLPEVERQVGADEA